MKVQEKIHHHDGSTTEREFTMAMTKGKVQVCWNLCPDDEPIAVKIIEAGWKDQGEKTYHVLTEWGSYEETSYSFLNYSQLLERFPDFEQITSQLYKDVVIDGLVIATLPNDATLGKHVRHESNG